MIYDILIVDDEDDIRLLLSEILKDEGYSTRLAASGEEALAALKFRRPDLVILDVWLGHGRYDGLDVLDFIIKNDPFVPVLMISGHGTVETAVAAIKRGAYDFIEKPFKTDKLLLLVQNAIEHTRLKQENRILKQKLGDPSGLLGQSPSIQNLRKILEKVAPTSSRVFITGPAGVGKELVAREIHALSKRSKGPFIVLNCANMTPDDLDTALFGSEEQQGHRIVGTLEQAHNGTLYLDEITDMPIATQAKFVRVLQDHTFMRVGGGTKLDVDVRIIASTRLDMQEEIQQKRFREDLFYRLNVVPIYVPPLRQRSEDIPCLADYFIQKVSALNGTLERPLTPQALLALQSYIWPGNVRELQNVIDRLLILAPDSSNEPITFDMLPAEIRGEIPEALALQKGPSLLSMPLREAREVFERQYLLAQVTKFSGNISQTASFVGMERSALHRKLKLLQQDKEPVKDEKD